MTHPTRTLLTLICEAALENRLIKDLEQLGAPGWTLSDAAAAAPAACAAPAGTTTVISAWRSFAVMS